jgi:hypothetical protein
VVIRVIGCSLKIINKQRIRTFDYTIFICLVPVLNTLSTNKICCMCSSTYRVGFSGGIRKCLAFGLEDAKAVVAGPKVEEC